MIEDQDKSKHKDWYTSGKIEYLLNYYLSPVNLAVKGAISDKQTLVSYLQSLGCTMPTPCKHIIPLNVNALTGELGKDTNHWAGLYISFQTVGVADISYINPMGFPINAGVKHILTNHLSDKFKIEIKEPLLGKSIQYVKQISNIESEGNLNDCGPILVYTMVCIDRVIEPANITSTGESASLGTYLRKAFNNRVNFNEIYKTTKKFENNGENDQESVTMMQEEVTPSAPLESIPHEVNNSEVGVSNNENASEDKDAESTNEYQFNNQRCGGITMTKSKTATHNFQQVLELFNKERYKINSKDSENAIVLGASGSGKSTLINYLLGNQLVAYKKDANAGTITGDQIVVKLKTAIVDSPMIGAKATSETSNVKQYISNKGHYTGTIWDCPGFEDNRGEVVDIVNALLISELLQKTDKAKLVLTVNVEDITHVRFKGFLDLLGQLQSMFGDLDHIQKNTVLVVTRAPKFVNDSEYSVNNIKQEINQKFDELLCQSQEYSSAIKFCRKLMQDNAITIFYQPDVEGVISSENAEDIAFGIEKIAAKKININNIGVSYKSREFILTNAPKLVEDITNDLKKIIKKMHDIVKDYRDERTSKEFFAYTAQKEQVLFTIKQQIFNDVRQEKSFESIVFKAINVLQQNGVSIFTNVELNHIAGKLNLIEFVGTLIGGNWSATCKNYFLSDVCNEYELISHQLKTRSVELMHAQHALDEEKYVQLTKVLDDTLNSSAKQHEELNEQIKKQANLYNKEMQKLQEMLQKQQHVKDDKDEYNRYQKMIEKLSNKIDDIGNDQRYTSRQIDEIQSNYVQQEKGFWEKCKEWIPSIAPIATSLLSKYAGPALTALSQLTQKAPMQIKYVNKLIYDNPILNKEEVLSAFSIEHGSASASSLISLMEELGKEFAVSILEDDDPVALCATLMGLDIESDTKIEVMDT